VSMVPRIVSGRAEMRPAFAGDLLRLNRMGDRYAFDVELPAMRDVAAQEGWGDLDDRDATLTLLIPQPGRIVQPQGLPRVNGAGQSGSSLILDGLTPQTVIRKRQWLNVTTGGRLFLYRAKSEVVANASGQVTVPLQTMLRRSPSDNDVVELEQPRIEGFATPTEDCWAIDVAGLVRPAFTIEERG
jgi:hypothetical protein